MKITASFCLVQLNHLVTRRKVMKEIVSLIPQLHKSSRPLHVKKVDKDDPMKVLKVLTDQSTQYALLWRQLDKKVFFLNTHQKNYTLQMSSTWNHVDETEHAGCHDGQTKLPRHGGWKIVWIKAVPVEIANEDIAISILASKVWDNAESRRTSPSVEFQLYKNGKLMNGHGHCNRLESSLTNLPDSDGKLNTATVKEAVPTIRFAQEEFSSQDGKATITNKRTLRPRR